MKINDETRAIFLRAMAWAMGGYAGGVGLGLFNGLGLHDSLGLAGHTALLGFVAGLVVSIVSLYWKPTGGIQFILACMLGASALLVCFHFLIGGRFEVGAFSSVSWVGAMIGGALGGAAGGAAQIFLRSIQRDRALGHKLW